jgi:DNA repair exonuclease SbcCD ATPase subunit
MLGKRVGSSILLAGVAHGVDVSPVEKVITLLEDLIEQTEDEGKAEASTYDEFACFCKDTTLDKSDSVTDGQDNIESLSASISEKTANRNEKIDEIASRKKRQEELAKTLEETKVRLEKERAEYEATAADLSKAINSLEAAMASLDEAKPSLIQVKGQIKKSLELAQILGIGQPAKLQKVTAFLQSSVDPSDPEYKYHSQGILDVLSDTLKDFNNEKKDVDAEWEKTETAENNLITDTEGQMTENSNSIETLEGDVETLATEIAGHREDLVDAEGLLKDDELYLKDLTERCEQRSHAYDQRSSMRAQELEALNTATGILKDKVKGADEGANERALLQEKAKAAPVTSFLQTSSSRSQLSNLLQKARGQTLSAEVQTEKVLSLLVSEGKRLNSVMLNSLAMKIKADPFKKVKELIQKLIERLVQEATAEATKKGFCDLELSKAEKNRNHRWQDVQRLNAELSAFEAKRDELEEELEELAAALKELNAALEEATKLRAESKAENLATLKEAKEGLTAVKEALLVLKVFYKNAGKAKVFLQASPVDEDDPGAASGAYKGNQQASKAILGLLEVIVSDFERTVKNTSAEEDKEAAEFVEFDRTSKADIGGKTTKTELNDQDLETTKTSIVEKSKDMQTNMDLVDKALEELEELKPLCIDTGMSYEERVEKREEEIDALKRALCILDTDGVEPECST